MSAAVNNQRDYCISVWEWMQSVERFGTTGAAEDLGVLRVIAASQPILSAAIPDALQTLLAVVNEVVTTGRFDPRLGQLVRQARQAWRDAFPSESHVLREPSPVQPITPAMFSPVMNGRARSGSCFFGPLDEEQN